MSALFIQMTENDRKLYEAPDWVVFDLEAMLDTPASKLDEWERTLGFSVHVLLIELDAASARAYRGALWIGLQLAGHPVEYDKFDPATLRTKRVWRNGPDDPPGNPEAGQDPAPDGISHSADSSPVGQSRRRSPR